MDELLQKIRQVEKQSIEDVEQAERDKESSIQAAKKNADERYEKELAVHRELLRKEQEQKVAGFDTQTDTIIAQGRQEADKTKQMPYTDIERAVRTVVERIVKE